MNHVTPPSPAEEPADQNERPSEQLTSRELQVIAGVTGAAAVHAIFPRPSKPPAEGDDQGKDKTGEEVDDEKSEPAAPALKYGPVGEIVSRTVFAGENHTGEVLDRYVDLYRGVFSHDKGIVTYFDAQGNNLAEEVLPDNWYVDVLGTPKKKGQKPPVVRPKMTKAEKQEWHNRHRQKAHTPDKVLPTEADDLGYPFIATATLYGMDREENEGVDTPFQLLDTRLNGEVEDPSERYFQGRKMTLRQAIIEIATAYDVPHAVAFGIGANESAFDRGAESDAGAKGLFQLTPGGYEDAKQYAESHPELSAPIREGKLLKFEQRFHGTREWKNRLVSTEMFCAYYRYLQEELELNFEQLEDRLRTLDPTFLVGTFDTIGTITAYNAGAPRIKKCIERFVKLSDEELKKKIGEPPYGVDVWMAMLAHSFGATLLGADGKPVKTKVGLHVLMYAPKSLALGSLITEEENHLSSLEREREEDASEIGAVEKREGGSRRSLLRAFFALTGAGALGGGVALGAQAVQEGREGQGLSRRTVLQGGAAVLAGTMVLGKSLPSSGKKVTEPKDDEIPTPPDETPRRYLHEKYDETLLSQAKATLDATHEVLKKRRKKGKHEPNYDWTSTEKNRIRKYTTSRQIEELHQDYKDAFGEDWVRRFSASVGEKRLIRRRPLYEEGQRLQDAYIADKIETGDWIRMEEDNPGKPYFCEQVGKMSGTGNNEKSLYMHKEFVPLLGSIIELVNHQIDLFNQNPAAYGELDPDFPIIPHVNAVKISGALRSVQQTYNMLEQGHAGATRNLSNHWIGQAIDLGSYKTQGSHMVTFAEPLYYLGTPQFAANSKLPSQGFGGRTRQLLSYMFGRALLALEEPLKEKGIKLMLLWEDIQCNWHVGIKL